MNASAAKPHGAEDLARRPVAEDVVIVLVDLQPQIVRRSRTNPDAVLLRASGVLVEGAGVFGIPLVRSIIRLDPTTVPEAIEELAGEHPLIRSTVGAFDHVGRRNAILAHGRPIIVIGGVSSEVAVLHAVLGAPLRLLRPCSGRCLRQP